MQYTLSGALSFLTKIFTQAFKASPPHPGCYTAFLIAMLCFFTSLSAFSMEKELEDKTAEKRSQQLFEIIRCMVCQGESIKESNTAFAISMRQFVKEQIKRGSTDQEITNLIESKYGKGALLKPTLNLNSLLLWVLPYLILICLLLSLFYKMVSGSFPHQNASPPTGSNNLE